MSYYTPKAAQAMLEWCNERIAKNFDVGRQNPFQFSYVRRCWFRPPVCDHKTLVADAVCSIHSHIHLVHTLEELDNLPEPKVRCDCSDPCVVRGVSA